MSKVDWKVCRFLNYQSQWKRKMVLINYCMEVLFQFKCDGASLSKTKENKMIILDLNAW
jgi:hypothetical protein